MNFSEIVEIPVNEICFDYASYIDSNGRVFKWNDNIYRGISLKREDLYRKLFKNGHIQELIAKRLLVPTEIVPFKLENYSLVLKHYHVKQKSYCVEWSSHMLKDAALLTLNLNLELIHNNFILQDAHPWNIYFEGTSPLFIDVGSIVEIDDTIIWNAYDQFCSLFLYPLLLASDKKSYVARLFLFNYWRGISHQELNQLLSVRYKLFHPLKILRAYFFEKVCRFLSTRGSIEEKIIRLSQKTHKSICTQKTRARFMHNMIREIESINIPVNNREWLEYDRNQHVNLCVKGINKLKTIDRILNECRPQTLLDIGCNRGTYSILGAQKNIQVIAIDIDENCISQLYESSKKNNYSILPLVVDFNNPTPSFGWCAKKFPSALERLKCDMVLALAISHHWIFKQGQNFDRITETLSMLTLRTLVFEFISPEDEVISLWRPKDLDGYSFENFKIAIEKNFIIETIFESDRPTRRLVLCHKKKFV